MDVDEQCSVMCSGCRQVQSIIYCLGFCQTNVSHRCFAYHDGGYGAGRLAMNSLDRALLSSKVT